MVEQKRACLIYVAATAAAREGVRRALEGQGFNVCEVEATEEEAAEAQAGEQDLPRELKECIEASDTCVFLLPPDATDDGLLPAGAGAAEGAGKSVIGVVCGVRNELPQIFEDIAQAVVLEGSSRLCDVILGQEIFEDATGTPRPPREIDHIRCQ
jgi:hypothetical protein